MEEIYKEIVGVPIVNKMKMVRGTSSVIRRIFLIWALFAKKPSFLTKNPVLVGAEVTIDFPGVP